MRILRAALVEAALPYAAYWVARQERRILQEGEPLRPEQADDARRVGVADPARVRLLRVAEVPMPTGRGLALLMQTVGIMQGVTLGLTMRHGIYIRAEYWNDRRLTVHELAHTAQYERLGGIRPFLRAYLRECIEPPGYPWGRLEQEACTKAHELCANV